jgi:hypothetical protein
MNSILFFPYNSSFSSVIPTNPANASSNVAHSFSPFSFSPLQFPTPPLNPQPRSCPAITTHNIRTPPSTPGLSPFPAINLPLYSPQSCWFASQIPPRHNFLLPPGPPTIGSQSFRGWSPLTPNARDSCRSSGP